MTSLTEDHHINTTGTHRYQFMAASIWIYRWKYITYMVQFFNSRLSVANYTTKFLEVWPSCHIQTPVHLILLVSRCWVITGEAPYPCLGKAPHFICRDFATVITVWIAWFCPYDCCWLVIISYKINFVDILVHVDKILLFFIFFVFTDWN